MDDEQDRPWGRFIILDSHRDGRWWVKKLIIDVDGRLSLQRHALRDETWVCVRGHVRARVVDFPRTLKNGDVRELRPGDVIQVMRGQAHRLENIWHSPSVLIEVATGTVEESDIDRLEDDYGRV